VNAAAVTPIRRREGRLSPETVAALTQALAERFGNKLVTSQAVREQHGHTLTWLANAPPDAVVFAESTEDVVDAVKLCAAHDAPIVAFGAGTSLEGHVNAPHGGVSIDLSRMSRIVAVHAQDLDCVVEPGVTREALNDAEDHRIGRQLFPQARRKSSAGSRRHCRWLQVLPRSIRDVTIMDPRATDIPSRLTSTMHRDIVHANRSHVIRLLHLLLLLLHQLVGSQFISLHRLVALPMQWIVE
jgi:hypothetical protein